MTETLKHWIEFAEKSGVRILTIAILALIFIRVLKVLTTRLVQRSQTQARAGQMREQQTRTMAGLLNSAGRMVIVAGAILMILPEFGFDITPVAAAAAVASLAFGFGAQSLVKDFINGFFIVIEDQYVVGDVIQLNGETGRVEHLTLRRTVIRNINGAIVTIPNSLVGQVSNLNRDWSHAFLDLTVPSDETVGRALATLEKVCGDFRNDAAWSPALVDGPRVLGIEALSLEGTVLRLQVRTVLNRKDDVTRELRRRIKLGFEESRIPLWSTQRVELQGTNLPPAT
jgi:moderate conductance mechanosensitive channel